MVDMLAFFIMFGVTFLVITVTVHRVGQGRGGRLEHLHRERRGLSEEIDDLSVRIAELEEELSFDQQLGLRARSTSASGRAQKGGAQ